MKIILFIIIMSIILGLLSYFQSYGQIETPPVLIATSQSPLATAYNNSRRLVRDDRERRYVVYQDVNQGVPIVCLVRSDNGITWSQPDTLTPGAFPAIAIDRNNRLYLVWQAPDQGGIFFSFSLDAGQSWQPPQQLSAPTAAGTQYPVVETGQQQVHVVWQQREMNQSSGNDQAIFYTSLPFIKLGADFPDAIKISHSDSATDSKFPALAHNTWFEQGKVHIVWYDSTTINGSAATLIKYRAKDELTENWYPSLSQDAFLLSDLNHPVSMHPAISVEFSQIIHIAWGTMDKSKIYHFKFFQDDVDTFRLSKAELGADPLTICLDDPIGFGVPIVWMKGNEICYMEILGSIYENPLYHTLSVEDSIKSAYPSVGYKHALMDAFDIVWIDGNAAPFKIIYQRKPKTGYGLVGNKSNNQDLESYYLYQNYPNPFNAATRICFDMQMPGLVKLEIYNLLGQKIRTLVSGSRQIGSYQVVWDGTDDAGQAVPSGIYWYQIHIGNYWQKKKVVLLR